MSLSGAPEGVLNRDRPSPLVLKQQPPCLTQSASRLLRDAQRLWHFLSTGCYPGWTRHFGSWYYPPASCIPAQLHCPSLTPLSPWRIPPWPLTLELPPPLSGQPGQVINVLCSKNPALEDHLIPNTCPIDC